MGKLLSFCITCKNRLHQVSRTLGANLRDNAHLKEIVEFVLVDFGSTDGLKEWVLKEFAEEIKEGYLHYYYSPDLQFWHASKAKNAAHVMACGEIVVNLDCDNFTGKNGSGFLLEIYQLLGDDLVFHQASGSPGDGSFGRISMSRKNFVFLGGYDESLGPMGFQDMDLIRRAVKFGLIYIINSNPGYNQAIPNSKEEGLINSSEKKSYMEMVIENMQWSADNIDKGQIIANDGIMEIADKMYHTTQHTTN